MAACWIELAVMMECCFAIQFGNQYGIINKAFLSLLVIDELLHITNVPCTISEGQK